jgi:hypothetical protein
MTIDPSTYPAIFIPHCEPSPSRRITAAVSQPLPDAPSSGFAWLHPWADSRGGRPRGPHPGDILYWVACLGGVCLLLLSAT